MASPGRNALSSYGSSSSRTEPKASPTQGSFSVMISYNGCEPCQRNGLVCYSPLMGVQSVLQNRVSEFSHFRYATVSGNSTYSEQNVFACGWRVRIGG